MEPQKTAVIAQYKDVVTRSKDQKETNASTEEKYQKGRESAEEMKTIS